MADNLGEREPWVEIHNAGAAPVSLDGLFLSDHYTNLARWAFPAGATLGPGGFTIVFADGQPAQSTAT